MKSVKNKQLVVGADFAGYHLKEAVVNIFATKVGKLQTWALRQIPTLMIQTLCFTE